MCNLNMNTEPEFSTRIDQLLEEEDNNESSKKNVQQQQEKYQQLVLPSKNWCNFEKEALLKYLTPSVLFVLFTNHTVLSMFVQYFPFLFDQNGPVVSYNTIGCILFGCVFTFLLAFLS